MNSTTVSILEGSTFVISDRRGDIEAEALQSLAHLRVNAPRLDAAVQGGQLGLVRLHRVVEGVGERDGGLASADGGVR